MHSRNVQTITIGGGLGTATFAFPARAEPYRVLSVAFRVTADISATQRYALLTLSTGSILLQRFALGAMIDSVINNCFFVPSDAYASLDAINLADTSRQLVAGMGTAPLWVDPGNQLTLTIDSGQAADVVSNIVMQISFSERGATEEK